MNGGFRMTTVDSSTAREYPLCVAGGDLILVRSLLINEEPYVQHDRMNAPLRLQYLMVLVLVPGTTNIMVH